MSKKTPIETREKLIQATAQLVMVNGINRVTLEQIALEAGVSKGGLLHHFPTKQALLSGLIEQIGEIFGNRLEKHMQLEPTGQPGRFARAYILASFEYAPDELQVTNAIAKVISEFPELLEELVVYFDQIDGEMRNDGLPAARATVIRLACDGLWLSELIGGNLQEPLREQMRDELLAMTNLEPANLEPVNLEQPQPDSGHLEGSR